MEHYKLTKGDAIKYLIVVLLSALLTLLLAPKQATPNLNNQEKRTSNVTEAAATAKPQNVSPIGVKAKAEKPIKKVSKPKPKPPTTHTELMAAAGIQSKDYASVDYIISHESSWNPNATEPTTKAHGLPQALPYSKTGCGWSDAVCQLKWASNYATVRYGGWSGAYEQWVNNRWW